jgi:hypothetical protein
MDQDHDKGAALPIACTLTQTEFELMRGGLLPGLLARAVERESVTDGFRWRFAFQGDLLKQTAAVIETEHQCCRFLRFSLVVEPGDGPLWLTITGPPGTEEFLSTLQDTTRLSPQV